MKVVLVSFTLIYSATCALVLSFTLIYSATCALVLSFHNICAGVHVLCEALVLTVVCIIGVCQSSDCSPKWLHSCASVL